MAWETNGEEGDAIDGSVEFSICSVWVFMSEISWKCGDPLSLNVRSCTPRTSPGGITRLRCVGSPAWLGLSDLRASHNLVV